MTHWYTVEGIDPTDPNGGTELDRLVAAWADAPVENEETLTYLLDLARRDVIEYAPALPVSAEGEPPAEYPSFYAYAQLRQAENLWNAGRAQGGGDVGVDGFTFTPRPLDKTIKRMIRPESLGLDVL